MDDDQKWLEAAAAIEQDIIYLKAATADAKRNGIPLGLEQEILQLNCRAGCLPDERRKRRRLP